MSLLSVTLCCPGVREQEAAGEALTAYMLGSLASPLWLCLPPGPSAFPWVSRSHLYCSMIPIILNFTPSVLF